MFRKDRNPNEIVTTTILCHDYEHSGDYNRTIYRAQKVVPSLKPVYRRLDGSLMHIDVEIPAKDILKAIQLKSMYDMEFYRKGECYPIEFGEYFDEYNTTKDLPEFKGRLNEFKVHPDNMATYVQYRHHIWEEFKELGLEKMKSTDNRYSRFKDKEGNIYEWDMLAPKTNGAYIDIYLAIKNNKFDGNVKKIVK